jgi:hypothetical protein
MTSTKANKLNALYTSLAPGATLTPQDLIAALRD